VRWWSEEKNSPGARSTQDALNELFQFDMEHGTGMFWGIKIYMLVYKYSPAEEKTYYQKQYYILKKKKLFMFTATFTKKTMQTIAVEVEKMIASMVSFNEKEIYKFLEQF
jgi:hypothetical protein